jgi:hypothetical protein
LKYYGVEKKGDKNMGCLVTKKGAKGVMTIDICKMLGEETCDINSNAPEIM